MDVRLKAMKLAYWSFFVLGVLTVVAFWSSMNGWFEKAVLLWMSGMYPMVGATISHIISRRWEKGWEELLDTLKFALFWLYGVLSWPLSYEIYRKAIDYYQTKKWYERVGIDYPREVVRKESLWEYLTKK